MRRPAFLGSTVFLMLASAVIARTWYITPDGSGDAPTIKAGIDSACAGDTILAACGTYYEHDIDMRSGVILLSETEDGSCAIVDAQEQGSVFSCFMCDSSTIIEGFSIRNGVPYFSVPAEGGGIWASVSWLTVRRCTFSGNKAGRGGAVHVIGGHVKFEDCVFRENWADQGAALLAESGGVTVTGCTFTDNECDKGTVYLGAGNHLFSECTFYSNSVISTGSGVYCADFSSPLVERTIFSDGVNGAAVSCSEAGSVALSCCDIYRHSGGDWVDCIADQYGANGNFSADPRFCDADGGDFYLEECSPCLPGNHSDSLYCWGTVGAHEAGCACTGPIRPSTWGGIKSMYR
jgi:hypothetical protein